MRLHMKLIYSIVIIIIIRIQPIRNADEAEARSRSLSLSPSFNFESLCCMTTYIVYAHLAGVKLLSGPEYDECNKPN